jgi:hypothetical protein
MKLPRASMARPIYQAAALPWEERAGAGQGERPPESLAQGYIQVRNHIYVAFTRAACSVLLKLVESCGNKQAVTCASAAQRSQAEIARACHALGFGQSHARG